MEYQFKNIRKNFEQLRVLKDIDIKFQDKKIVAILGPSGCGKTTLLNIISSTIKPDEGELVGFNNKSISYIFQEPRLMKWKTVYDNIDFVIKDKMSKEERKSIIDRNLKMLDLLEYKDYYPSDLSGGMKQRVAIARAFVYPSDILLMDEPFKSLDLELKFNLIYSFLNLWQIDKRTVFFVTHDIQAALLLGDYIYILSQKPTIVKEKIENKLAYDERSLKNKYILSLEEKIYRNFSVF